MKIKPLPAWPDLHWKIYLLSFVISASVTRLLLLSRSESAYFHDLRGLVSDFASAFIVVTSASVLFRRHPAIGLGATYFLWLVLNAINAEHILALGDVASYTEVPLALSPTFLRGSLGHTSYPITYFALLALPFSLLALASRRQGRLAPRALSRRLSILLTGVLACTALWVAAPQPDKAMWRQAGVFEANIRQMLAADPLAGDATQPLKRASSDIIDDVGELRAPLPKNNRNVLLIMIEGLSHSLIDPGRSGSSEAEPTMPKLARFASENVNFRQYLGHQRKTIKGLYSILCGDLPNFSIHKVKPDFYNDDPGVRRKCLPALLNEEGYRTIYIQSADLSYMRKDEFLPLAGFEEVYGEQSFQNPKLKGGWGVSDRDVFERTLDTVNDLQADGDPWLLAVLTSGTHHPYTIPNRWRKRYDGPALQAAFAYSDHFLGQLLEQLKSLHVLDDTLVIVTGDEGSRFLAMNEDGPIPMDGHWMTLVAAHAELAAQEVDDVFSTSDFAPSILDYAGKRAPAHFNARRSIFRQYPTPRTLFWGHIYSRNIWSFDEHTLVLSHCSLDLRKCREYEYASSAFLGQKPVRSYPDDGRAASVFREFIKSNDWR